MQTWLQNILRWDLNSTEKIRINAIPRWRWWLVTIIAHSGDSWYCLAVLGFLWLFSEGLWKTVAAGLGIGTFFLAIFIILLKFKVKRPRPKGEWGEIYRNTDPHSFPSGHATRVFFLASMAWGIAPDWFALVLSIWAPLVALSRVMTGVHYVVDVLAGILIGLLFGKIGVLLLPLIMQWFPFIF